MRNVKPRRDMKKDWLLFLLAVPSMAVAQDLAETVEWNQGIFSPPSGSAWRATTDGAFDGVDCVISDTGTGPGLPLGLSVTGPGEFRFRWKQQGPLGGLTFAWQNGAGFTADELGVGNGAGGTFSVTGIMEWQERIIKLAPGPNLLTWQHHRGSLTDGTFNAARLDTFSTTPQWEPATIAEAVDAPGKMWTPAPGQPFYGISFQQNGIGQKLAVLQSSGTGPGEVLRVPVAAGWFAVRQRSAGSLTVALADGTPARTGYEMASGWGNSFGFSPVPQDLIWTSASAAQTILIDTLRDGMTSYTEALESDPTSVWTAVQPIPGMVQIRGLDAASDGVDSVRLDHSSSGLSGALETPFERPGRVSLNLKGGVAVSRGGFQLSQFLTGGLTSTVWPDWRPVEFLLPPGTGLLRFTGNPTAGGEIDAVQLTRFPAVGAADAMDSPALAWTLPGGDNATWYPVQDAAGSRDGIDCLRAGPWRESGAAASTWDGAGSLELAVFSTAAAEVQLALDGRAPVGVSLPDRWQKTRIEVPAGQHTAEWNYVVPVVSPPADQRHAMLDAAQWTSGLNSYSEAAGNGAATWISGGDEVWAITATDAVEGTTSLSSPRVQAGRGAWIETHFTGPAEVRFFWKGQGTADFSLITGTASEPVTLSGSADWHERVITVPTTGPGRLRWTMTADGFLATPAGAALLDNIRINPLPPLSSPISSAALAALDIGGLEVRQQGGVMEVVGPELARDGISSLKLSRLPPPATGAGVVPLLQMTVAGPYELSFWWRAEGLGSIPAGNASANNQVTLAANGHANWRCALLCDSGPGPHLIEWRPAWSAGTGQFLLLDGLTLTTYGTAGTFSGSLGSPAGARMRASNLGTDHALADTSVNHDGSASVRLGSDAEAVVLETGARLASWWQRHDRRDAGKRLGGPANTWYNKTWEITQAPPVVSTGTAQAGWHVWLDDLTSSTRDWTVGEFLRSPELLWTAAPPGAWTMENELLSLTDPTAATSTTFTGPGYVYSNLATANVTLDGVSSTVDGSYFAPVGAGTHTLSFGVKPGGTLVRLARPAVFARSASAEAGLDLDLVPAVSVVSLPGDLGGLAHPALAVDGEDAAVTPSLTGTPLEFAFSVTGPGRLRIQSSILTGSADLSARVDNGSPVSSSDVTVPAGTHTVTYSATASDTGENRLLLDMLTWHPDDSMAAPDVAGGLDSAGLDWTTRAARPFTTIPAPGAVGGTLAASPALGGGEFSWLETSINGPGFFILKPSVNLLPATSTSDGKFTASWPGSTPVIITANGKDKILRIPAAGPLAVRFSWSNGPTSLLAEGNVEQLMLDDLIFVPDSAPGQPPQNLLPVAGLTWGVPAGTAATWRAMDLGSRGPTLVSLGGSTTTQVLPFSLAATGRLVWSFLRTGTNDTLRLHQPATNLTLKTSFTEADWSTPDAYCLPAQNSLEFRSTNGGLNDVYLLRGISLTSNPVSLTEALDTPGLTWNTGGDAAWQGYVRSSTDESASHGPMDHNQSTWIETTVTAPCWLSWQGTLWSESGDGMSLTANGVPIFTRAGSGSSQTLTDTRRIAGNGPLTLRWTYSKNAAVSSGADALTLLGALIIPDDTTGTAGAADVDGLTFTQGSNAGIPFVAETYASAVRGGTVVRARAPSALSPPSPALSWLDAQVNGPGLLTFASEGAFSYFINGTATSKVMPWTVPAGDPANLMRRSSLEITGTGPQTIRLQATLANATAVSSLDDLHFNPAQPLSSMAAPGLTWSTSPLPWTAYGSNDWKIIASPDLVSGQGAWLEAAVTGPGVFDFTATGNGTFSVNEIPDGVTTGRRQIHLPAGQFRLRWDSVASPAISPQKVLLHHFTWTAGPSPLAAISGENPVPLIFPNPTLFTLQTVSPPDLGPDYLKAGTLSTPNFRVLLPAPGRLSLLARSGAGEWKTRTLPASETAAFQTIAFEQFAVDNFNQVTSLTFRPGSAVSDQEAVDSDCITWLPASAGIWQGIPTHTTSRDGEDILSGTAPSAFLPAVRSGSITGPAVFRFWWSGAGTLAVNGQACAFLNQGSTIPDPSWRQIQVDLAAGPHVLTWSSSSSLRLDGFTCTSQPDLLPALPALVKAAVTESGAWQPGTGQELRAGPVTNNKDLTLLMQGPALYSPGFPLDPLVISPFYLQFVPDSGLFTHKFSFAPSVRSARIEAASLTEVSPSVALGRTVRSSGWRGFRGGGYEFATAAPSSNANLETDVQGPVTLHWQGDGSLEMSINNAPATQPGLVYPLQYIPLPEGLQTIKWVSKGLSFPDFLSRLGTTPMTPQNNFAAWTQAAGLPPGTSQPGSNPDGDQRTNLQEFIYGGNPGLSDSTFSSPLSVFRNGQFYPAIEFTARGDGFTYRMETLDSGSTLWFTLPAELEILSEAFPYRRFRLTSTGPLGIATMILRVRGNGL